MEPKSFTWYREDFVPVNNDGFIIGSKVGVDNHTYSFSTHQARHATYEKASAEAERLAKLNPGKTFVVFKPVSEHRITEVINKPIRF